MYGFYNNNGFPEKWENDNYVFTKIKDDLIVSNGPYNETVKNFIYSY